MVLLLRAVFENYKYAKLGKKCELEKIKVMFN